MTTARHEAHAATMVDHRAIAMIAGRLATVMNALVDSIVLLALLVVVMNALVVSIEILVRRGIGMIVLAVLIVTLVHLVMVAIDQVVSIVIRVRRVTVMIVLAVLIVTLVLHVTVMTGLVVSIEILVHLVIAMIVLVALTVMTVLVVLIAMTVHHALQRKIVQMKCVAALVNVVHPEKCHHHLSVHAKSGLTKVQFVQSVNQMWVAFAQRAQVVRKRADVKKCVLSTPLWNSLSVH